MRTVYLIDREFPPTEDDIAKSAEADAAELMCGIRPALAALGVNSFGLPQIEDGWAIRWTIA